MSMTGAEFQVWRVVYERFLAALAAEQEDRHKRGNPAPISGELGWITHERRFMFEMVNNERAKRGLPFVTLAEVESVENLACGHVDYTKKFALGCADLATRNP